jgi:hypothetical protein
VWWDGNGYDPLRSSFVLALMLNHSAFLVVQFQGPESVCGCRILLKSTSLIYYARLAEEVSSIHFPPRLTQVWSNGVILAVFSEVFDLLFGRVDLRVQLGEVLLVELSRDGLVDVFCHCVVPERRIFLYGIRTGDISGANNILSANRTEIGVRTYSVWPTPRGSHVTSS